MISLTIVGNYKNVMKIKKLSVVFIIGVVILSSCSKEKKSQENISFPLPTETSGLIQPILLNPDSTIIDIDDYFNNCRNINRVTFSGKIKPTFRENGIIKLEYSDSILPISIARFWFEGTAYSLVLKKTQKVKHLFTYKQSKDIPPVYIAGDFNNWNETATPMIYENEEWSIEIELPIGKTEYYFIVNGEKILDAENIDSIINKDGETCSVLTVENNINADDTALSLHSVEGNDVYVSYKEKPKEFMVFWDNFQIAKSLVGINEESKLIRFSIPENTKNVDTSYMRVFSYNDSGISNELLIPLQKNVVIQNDVATKK